MQRALIIFLFSSLLVGCGYTQLPMIPPIIVRGQIITIRPTTIYWIDSYTDSLSVPNEYISIGKISGCVEKTAFEKEDKEYVIEKLRIEGFAIGIDADAVTNLLFYERESLPDIYYTIANIGLGDPLVLLPKKQLCAEGTIIKYLKNIPFIDSSYITLKFPLNYYFDVSLIDMDGKKTIVGENITKDIYPFIIDSLDTGIYRLEVVARNGPNWGISQVLWISSRWIELRRRSKEG